MMLKELENIIAKERVVFAIPSKYTHDDYMDEEGSAKVLVFPISTEEVSKIMTFAHKNNLQVIPIGANTNLVAATFPKNTDILLDLSKMNKICEIDKSSFTATVESGVLLCDLSSEVLKQGLFYAPDPGEKKATIGGNIATNAGGMRAVKYGTTRDSVRGLEVVLSDGRIINVGSKNIKDSSGLSLKHLFIGSEGQLGIITKAILKLFPAPTQTITGVFGFKDFHQGADVINKIMLANTEPVALEFIQSEVIELGKKYSELDFPFPNSVAYVIVSFDGDGIDRKIKITEQIAKENGADFVAITDEKEIANVWKMRSDLHNAVVTIEGVELETVDIVVPLNKIPSFMLKVKEIEKNGLKTYSFGHAGDGNIHLSILQGSIKNEDVDIEVERAMEELYKYSLKELGGLVSGEHGIGLCKQKYFLKNTDETNLELMREIKNIFDPKHILNSGKVYDKK